jgi:hypothetical protein
MQQKANGEYSYFDVLFLFVELLVFIGILGSILFCRILVIKIGIKFCFGFYISKLGTVESRYNGARLNGDRTFWKKFTVPSIEKFH